MPDVSIIIVNFRSSRLVSEAVKSVISFTSGLDYEIIIVDNDSGDGSVELLAEEFGTRIRLIPLEKNYGFGIANNRGIEIASGRNILFLNPDTILISNAVKTLSDHLDLNPGTGIAGGNLLTAGMTEAFSFRRFLPSFFWELNDFFFGVPEKILYGKNRNFSHNSGPLKVGYISGAAIMIPVKVLKKSGGFDPAFFLYFEETDLCLRIRKLGYKIICLSQSRIIHMEGGTLDSSRSRLLYYFRSKDIYYKKNLTRSGYRMVNLIILLTFSLRLCLFRIMGSQVKFNYWKRLCIINKIAVRKRLQ